MFTIVRDNVFLSFFIYFMKIRRKYHYKEFYLWSFDITHVVQKDRSLHNQYSAPRQNLKNIFLQNSNHQLNIVKYRAQAWYNFYSGIFVDSRNLSKEVSRVSLAYKYILSARDIFLVDFALFALTYSICGYRSANLL